jgi:predicted DNA-binding transcriptional regulator AlpA
VDLIGLTQIAELLGMSRAGAHKLIGRETTFPAPVSVLANRTRVWDRADVERWAREKGRLK